MKSSVGVIGYLVHRRDRDYLYIARVNRSPWKAKGASVFLNGKEISGVPDKYEIDLEPIFSAKVNGELVDVDVDVKSLSWEEPSGEIDLNLARNIGYPEGRLGADTMPEILREIRHLLPFRMFRGDMLDRIERAIDCRIEIDGEMLVVYRDDNSGPLFEVQAGPKPCYECRDLREVRSVLTYWDKKISSEIRKLDQVA